MRYKVTVHEVTNWEEGNESQADYCHGVEMSDIMRAMANEYEAKMESEEWNDRQKRLKNLPFVWNGSADDEDEAVAFALQSLQDKLCYGDYYEATDGDYTVEEIKQPRKKRK